MSKSGVQLLVTQKIGLIIYNQLHRKWNGGEIQVLQRGADGSTGGIGFVVDNHSVDGVIASAQFQQTVDQPPLPWLGGNQLVAVPPDGADGADVRKRRYVCTDHE